MRVASLFLFIALSAPEIAAQSPAKDVDTCSLLTNAEAASIVEGIGNGHLLRDHIQRKICIWEVLPPDWAKRPLWIQVRQFTIEQFNSIRPSPVGNPNSTKVTDVGDEAFDVLTAFDYEIYVRKGSAAFSVKVEVPTRTLFPLASSTARAAAIKVAGRI